MRLGMQIATPLDPPLSGGQVSTPQNREEIHRNPQKHPYQSAEIPKQIPYRAWVSKIGLKNRELNGSAIEAIFFDSFRQICYYFTIFSTFVVLILKIVQALELNKNEKQSKTGNPIIA